MIIAKVLYKVAGLVYNMCPSLIEILKKLIENFSADHQSIWRPIKRGKHQKDWSIWKEKNPKYNIYVSTHPESKQLAQEMAEMMMLIDQSIINIQYV